MDLIVTNENGIDILSTDDYNIDLAFGSGENSFELTCTSPIQAGAYVYIDGTEYGGIIDRIEVDTDTQKTVYSGRTWQGIIESKILSPPDGQDYLVVSGSSHSVLKDLISRLGLGGLFIAVVPKTPKHIARYQFARYINAYDGITKLCIENGLKLVMRNVAGTLNCALEPLVTYTDDIDSDLLSFKSSRVFAPVNHLICLGKGDLRDRLVIHYFADAKGVVSTQQTFTGLKEICTTYEFTNAEEDELRKKGKEKLEGLQTHGSIEVDITSGKNYDVGDILVGRDNQTGQTVTARIIKKIVKSDGCSMNVSYECGNDSTSRMTHSDVSASGGGGHAYYAGDGLSLSGYTFNADVTQSELDEVSKQAQESYAAASNASALAAGKLSNVTASPPLKYAYQSQTHSVSLSHDISGVIEATYGPKTDVRPQWGESVVVGSEQIIDVYGHTKSAQDHTVTIPDSVATHDTSGLMSSADKSKLDLIENNANNYKLPVATPAVLGGVRPDGKTITISDDGLISAQMGSAASFLAAWPVGSVYQSTIATNPGEIYGGTWRQLDSIGPYTFERIS